MAGNASRANGLKGGRPKGRKSDATLEREAVEAAMKQRIWQLADRLVSAQLAQAEGVSFLFRKAKSGGKVERVTDEATIAAYLDGALDDKGTAWYFIAAERPSAEAADRLLNRGLGTPPKAIELSGPGGGPVQTKVIFEVVDAD